MTTADREKLHFDKIKEHRGSYFVEYEPPFGRSGFATVNLVYPGAFDLKQVADDMRAEMLQWLARYPVPVMIFAFGATEDVIRPNGPGGGSSLVGWFIPGKDEITSSWKVDEIPAFINDAASLPDLRAVYKDVSFKTDAEVKANAQRHLLNTRKKNRTLRIFLAFWIAVIPATWASIQYFGPSWLESAVYIYALWQAFRAGRKLFGHRKLSRAEEQKAEKERKMAHYYYHCNRNPDGFSRLMVENLEKDISERTRKEAEELEKVSGLRID